MVLDVRGFEEFCGESFGVSALALGMDLSGPRMKACRTRSTPSRRTQFPHNPSL